MNRENLFPLLQVSPLPHFRLYVLFLQPKPLPQRCRMHARRGEVGHVMEIRNSIVSMGNSGGNGHAVSGMHSMDDSVALAVSEDVELRMGKFGAAIKWGAVGGVEVSYSHGDSHAGNRNSVDAISSSSSDARKCTWWLPALIMTARVNFVPDPSHRCYSSHFHCLCRCSGMCSPQPAT